MGFRSGSYAHVWEVTPMNATCTKIRISISRKNKETGEYEQDFSGYAIVIGTAASQKALSLTKDSRIKIGDCDVSTRYDKEKGVQYTNFKIFNFEDVTNTNSENKTEVDAPSEGYATEEEFGGDNPFNTPF